MMTPLLALCALRPTLVALSPITPQNQVKGTAPMPGGLGKFGQTYTVSKEGTPMNFTILSAQYSLDTYNIKSSAAQMVDTTHKLLVIHYRIKNPNKADMYVTSWPLFQAVDSNDTTTQDAGESRRATDKESLSLTLKPGQGVDDVVTYISVPADAKIPKLIFQYAPAGTNYKVIRFMMGTAPNVIKPLAAPFADPADKSGSTALPQIPAMVGTTYSTGFCDMSVDSISLASGPLGSTQADNGKQFLIAKITSTNKAWAHEYYNGSYKASVKTDDDKIEAYTLLKASHDENFEGLTLESGDATSHRMVFQVAKDAKLKTLSISIDMGNDGITRSFVYDLSDVK